MRTEPKIKQPQAVYKLRSPAGTTEGNIFLSGGHHILIWWPPDNDVVATTSLCGGHQIVNWWPPVIWWAPDSIWWPPDNYVVATTSLSGGHPITMWTWWPPDKKYFLHWYQRGSVINRLFALSDTRRLQFANAKAV